MSANTERTRKGRDLIEYYSATEQDGTIHADDFRDYAVDIIADILHTLDSEGHDALKASDMARRHFLAEHAEGDSR